MKTKALAIACFAATTALSTLPIGPHRQTGAKTCPSFRIGLLGGAKTKLTACATMNAWQTALSERLGVPVEMFPAPDYAGVMQGPAGRSA